MVMSQSNFIRIVVADDHPIVRQGLAAIIERELDMTVVGQASNGWEAKELYCTKRPDVMLMDLRMPELEGVTTIKGILNKSNSANIIIITTYDGDEDIYKGIKAGAKGYLLKDTEPEEILSAIRIVAGGKNYITPTVATKLKERMKKPELSERELEVIQLITDGNTNQQVAATLHITEGTVKYHVNNILTKLQVKDRTQAVVAAIKRGIVKF
jgi:two-component system, NarL family, response regulator